jgi:hypothetical protein
MSSYELARKFKMRYPNCPHPKHQPKVFDHYFKMFLREEGLTVRSSRVDIWV